LAKGEREWSKFFFKPFYIFATYKNLWSKYGKFNLFFFLEIWLLWAPSFFFQIILLYKSSPNTPSPSHFVLGDKWQNSTTQKIFTTLRPTLWVCHTMALPFTLKEYLKAKDELWKPKNISSMQKYNLLKKSSKRNQNPSRYYNSIITNLNFQHEPKYHLSKILI